MSKKKARFFSTSVTDSNVIIGVLLFVLIGFQGACSVFKDVGECYMDKYAEVMSKSPVIVRVEKKVEVVKYVRVQTPIIEDKTEKRGVWVKNTTDKTQVFFVNQKYPKSIKNGDGSEKVEIISGDVFFASNKKVNSIMRFIIKAKKGYFVNVELKKYPAERYVIIYDDGKFKEVSKEIFIK